MADAPMNLPATPIGGMGQVAQQRAFANARFAKQHDHARLSGACLIQCSQHTTAFGDAPDQTAHGARFSAAARQVKLLEELIC